MRNCILFIFLAFTTIVSKAQQVVIDSTLIIEKTSIKFIRYDSIDNGPFKLYERVYDSVSRHSFTNDTLRLSFSRRGLAGQSFVLKISDTIIPEIILWSDYPAYDGKITKHIEVECSELKTNKRHYKLGDTLKIKLKCVSKPNQKYMGNQKFEYYGTINHIIKID